MKYQFFILLSVLALFSITSVEASPLTIHSADKIVYLEEVQILKGTRVDVEYAAMRLKADYLKVNFAERIILAEGNIVLYYDEEKFYGTNLTYNLETELWSLSEPETILHHWFIKGKKLRKIDDRVYIMERASIICLCPRPCYRITAQEVVVHLQDKLRAYRSFFWIEGVPVLFLPIYEASLREVVEYPGYGTPDTFSMRPGHDTYKGWSLLTYYNWYVNPQLRGRFYLDHFEYLDTGIGFDVEYETKDGEGFFYVYYVEEEVYPEEHNRWKLHLRHRQKIREDMVGLLRVDSFSDADFNVDFESEEKWRRFTEGELDYQRENPEGSFSLLQMRPNYAVELRTRMRLNNWVSPFTERVPELSFDLFRQRIGNTSLFWDADKSITRLRHFPGGESITQANVNFEISRPGSIGWLRLEPALRGEGFWYNRDRAGRKSVYMGNYELSLSVHTRLYSLPFRFGRMKMHHLFEPRLAYYYSPPPPARREDLFEFVDKLDDEKDFFDLEVGNRFIMHLDDETKKDFADLNLKTRFYSDGRENPWGPLITELSLYPVDGMSLLGWMRYDINIERLEAIEARFSWQITPDWKIALLGHYDWRNAHYEEWEVNLTRRIRCWKIHFSFRSELDETRAFIGFQLKNIIDDLRGIEIVTR